MYKNKLNFMRKKTFRDRQISELKQQVLNAFMFSKICFDEEIA